MLGVSWVACVGSPPFLWHCRPFPLDCVSLVADSSMLELLLLVLQVLHLLLEASTPLQELEVGERLQRLKSVCSRIPLLFDISL